MQIPTNKIITPINTAVLLLIFNRPNTSIKVFEKICQAKPLKLYIAGDGPRVGKVGDKEKVNKARAIVNKINWPCEVKTLFSEKNLGCKKGVSSAITWFFNQEEKGIILEDDCVPCLDFFNFCQNSLDYYSKDNKIFAINGSNFQNNKWRGEASYYFSKYFHCWGWATWKRSWKNYDGDIKFWPKWSNSKAWSDFIPDKIERRYWKKIFDLVYAGKIDSWAYPMLASMWFKNKIVINPNVNLVSNIGFGEDATHTKKANNQESFIQTQSLGKIIHPKLIEINYDADKYDFEYTYNGRNLRFPRNWIIAPKRIVYFFFKKIYKLIKIIK